MPPSPPVKPPAEPASCGCGGAPITPQDLAKKIGYSAEELAALPEGANMGLSCGNPAALAALKPGEVVLDLGSGGGFDVFIAGRKVGATGPRHRRGHDAGNAGQGAPQHRAVIASRPAWTTSSSASAKSSICPWPTTAWTSSSPIASSTFRRTNRRSGAKWPACSSPAGAWPCPTWRCCAVAAAVREMVEALIGCVAGAVLVEETERMAREAGLTDIVLTRQIRFPRGHGGLEDPLYRKIAEHLPAGTEAADFVTSLEIKARKPRE